MNWIEKELQELCKITRGSSPRPIQNWMTERSDGIPWIKISDASASKGRTIEKTAGRILQAGRAKSVSVNSGDLIVSNSATPGIPMFVGLSACIHDGWLLLRDFKNSDPLFLFYLLRHERRNLLAQGNGSVFTNLKTEILKRHSVKIPELGEQKAIAHILGSLDDKIEINQKMNETLEEIAKAIFKSWFVDFDPVRAKMDGRPTGLPDDISNLFPDELVDSEIGEIPKGWINANIGDYFDCLDRKRIPLSGNERAKRHGEFPYYGATGIIDYLDDYIFDGKYLLIGEDGSVERKNGTAFAQYVSGKIWVNNHAHVLQGKNGISTEILYLAFQFIKVSPFITGAVQLKISQKNLRNIPFTKPNQEIVANFEGIVSPIFSKRLLLEQENIILADLRDTLLPKLISGELQIPDAEKFLEEAGI